LWVTAHMNSCSSPSSPPSTSRPSSASLQSRSRAWFLKAGTESHHVRGLLSAEMGLPDMDLRIQPDICSHETLLIDGSKVHRQLLESCSSHLERSKSGQILAIYGARLLNQSLRKVGLTLPHLVPGCYVDTLYESLGTDAQLEDNFSHQGRYRTLNASSDDERPIAKASKHDLELLVPRVKYYPKTGIQLRLLHRRKGRKPLEHRLRDHRVAR
jgi:hypothetical protein